ncbi:MAG: molybdopterin oxidoreductase family protein [Myxococcales bacterium]|nr:molybdopterin oxidoreductase family protein [Myxococcales bacterium]
MRDGDGFREATWDEALDYAARRLADIRDQHGADAVATYQGNPGAHNLGILTFGQLFLRKLGTRNAFSATSADQLPHMLASLEMFGDSVLMGVPDIDRAELFLCFGGNPLVSNGSIMTAPDMKRRLKAIQARGGRVVVVDPRRTETAALADEHLPVRPGGDALLMLSMLHVLFAEGLTRPGRVGAFTDGLDTLAAVARHYAPEDTAPRTGVAPDAVRALARDFAARRGVAYGRMGICTQEFGALSAWLVVALNLVCGRLDEPGGLMFTTPAVDLEQLTRLVSFDNGFDRYRSRVRGLPEFNGELPVVTMAEEIERKGPDRVRALVTVAGNPVLSIPNGARLERALGQLELVVCVDPYLNETTRHADVILPPTSPLQRSHYDLALMAFAVRNGAKYAPPLFPRGEDQRHDWEICLELVTRMGLPGFGLGALGPLAAKVLGPVLHKVGPDGILDLALRAGPHGLRKGRAGLSLKKLKAAPHGVDLGPLEPRLPERLRTPSKRIDAAPPRILADLGRLRATLTEPAPELVLIGRRQLRSNNSWCHNSYRLVKGKPRCTLLMHPKDAAARGLVDGDEATLTSRAGTVRAPVEVTDAMMPGVVSLPHGWGHGREGTRLSIAARVPGVSVNDVTDERFYDRLSGNAGFSGVAVEVARVPTVVTA